MHLSRSPSPPLDDEGQLADVDLEHRMLDAWEANVAILDAGGRVVAVNAAWERFARVNGGIGVGVGTDYLAVCDASERGDADVAATADGLRAVLDGSSPRFRSEYPCHSPAERRWFEVTARPFRFAGGTGAIVVHTDVTERTRLVDDARTRTAIVDELDAAVTATDIDGIVTSWSQGAERLYGWTEDEAVCRPIWELITAPEAVAEMRGSITEILAHGAWEGVYTATRKDGTSVEVYVRNVVFHDADGVAAGMASIAVDRTERVAMDNRLQAITDSIGDGLCTLDEGGLITYVNPPGRRMLRVRPLEPVSGSFLRWVHAVEGQEDWTPEPSDIEPRPIACQLVRRDGSELPIEYIATPLRADRAAPPTGWVVVFRDVSERRDREDARAEQLEEVRWLGRLRQALEHDGFELYAQPIVDLVTGVTIQHELLLRMVDPDDPQLAISPARFLPIAEALGIAPAIDRWVLAKGLEIAARGHPVEINLSATSFDDTALPHLIEQLFTEAGADPRNVVFEITETALLENHEPAHYFVERVRELGCEIALDDFGTGYGGFTYLTRFPIDYLKIDIEFVRDAVSDPASRHVIDAVVSLAKAFGLRTIAEGVEDLPTLTLLEQLGVDFAQGYVLGRPAPTSAVFPLPTRSGST